MELEYLSLFSNTGSTAVQVRFVSFEGSVRDQRMHPSELAKLIQLDQKGFVSRILVDEHPMKLQKIEILTEENRIVLHIRPLDRLSSGSLETSPSDHNIWVGSAYQASSPRILILGESDYGDTPPLEKYVPQWLNKKHRDYSFARMSNAFASSVPREFFWSQIAFYNFVPGKVGETRDDRPTAKSYVEAQPVLTEVLNLLKPDGVLILGIEQSEYSQAVVQRYGVAHSISPHPAARGLTNERLTSAWEDFMHALRASG